MTSNIKMNIEYILNKNIEMNLSDSDTDSDISIDDYNISIDNFNIDEIDNNYYKVKFIGYISEEYTDIEKWLYKLKKNNIANWCVNKSAGKLYTPKKNDKAALINLIKIIIGAFLQVFYSLYN